MKKPYIKPEMEIYEFDTEDVITTSGEDGNQTTVEINDTEED